VALALMAVMWIGFRAADPRSRGFQWFSGGYERELLEIVRGLTSRSNNDALDSPRNLFSRGLFVLNDQLPAGFFGEQLSLFSIRAEGRRYSPTSMVGSLVLIASSVLLWKRGHRTWALLCWGTIAVTVLISAEPRYYVMILPVLMLAWLLLVGSASVRLPGRWGEVALVAGLAVVTLNNVSASVSFIREQRSVPFLETYRYDRARKEGEWVRVVKMAELIRRHVPEGARVIGPSGSVLSYLSGRHVYTQRELLPRRGGVPDFPRMIADKAIEYAIFPAPLYRSKEPAMSRLMERGILRPDGGVIGDAGGMRLARLRVIVPDVDWTQLPKLYGSQSRAKPKPAPASKPAAADAP
jgi:hypothetical protein